MDTADACSAAGGYWKSYTCGDVQDEGISTMFPGKECDESSYFWHSIVPMYGSDPVTCCADPDKSRAEGPKTYGNLLSKFERMLRGEVGSLLRPITATER